MMCPYCGNTERIKRINGGYCFKYGCVDREMRDKESQKQHNFNQHPVVYKVKTVTTTETYNYGKLVKTETTIS